MAHNGISIGASLAYSWALWRAHWRQIWGVLAIFSLATTVHLAGTYASNDQLRVLGMIGSVITQLMVYGAVFRIAFADRHAGDAAYEPGATGLHWGAIEWRMLMTVVLLGVFFLIVGSVAAVAVGAVAVGIAMNNGMTTPPATPEALWAALGANGQSVVSVIGLIAFVFLVYFGARLSLATAATADSGRVAVLKSWPLTKGQALRIFASMLLLQLPLLSLQLLVTASAVGSDAAGVPAMSPGAAFFSALVVGVVSGGVVAPMLAGVLAYYYRSLAGPPGSLFRTDGGSDGR